MPLVMSGATKSFSFLLLWVILGCAQPPTSPKPPPTFLALEGLSYKVVGEDSKLENPGDKIFGVGKLLFVDPMPKQARNLIGFTFAIDDKGALTIIARASAALTDGLHLHFNRENDFISGRIITGLGDLDITEKIQTKIGDANGLLSLQLEFNDGGATRLLNEDGKELLVVSNFGTFSAAYYGLKLDHAEVFDVFSH